MILDNTLAGASQKYSGFLPAFSIGHRQVGGESPVLIIAEAGVCHFGDVKKALALVDLAVESGADIFKTQVFDTDRLVSSVSPEWRERLRCKELSKADIAIVKAYCDDKGIMFLATAHEENALAFLHDEIDMVAFKIGSGEVENWSFLRDIARRGKPMILSTGMYEIDQITKAIEIIASEGCQKLAVLHCVSLYPTPPEAVNLYVMQTIRSFFPGPVGYSDHTAGTAVPLAAVALGARIIEKHITLDINVPNAQDWKVACTPKAFPQFVADIRTIEKARGNGIKQISPAERESITWARKSVFAACDIPMGIVIKQEMLVSMRPGTGLPPSLIDQIVGCVASKDLPAGSMICEDDFNAV
ncbi:N-acetylneuraminate synthase family protein [Nitrospiraceae bacterium AH_259_D15_M11_P09]|nr:N-acetylneuraminate synthase family protein [Nitrospiraceae bacterium AH_259_D15_M11_P09]